MSELDTAPTKEEGFTDMISGWFSEFRKVLGSKGDNQQGAAADVDPALVKAKEAFTAEAKRVAADVAVLVKKTSAETAAKAQGLLDQAKLEAGAATLPGYQKGTATLAKADEELRGEFGKLLAEEQAAKVQKGKRGEYQTKLAEKQEVLGRLAELPGMSMTPELKRLNTLVVKAQQAADKDLCEDALRILGGLDGINEKEFAKQSEGIVKQLAAQPEYGEANKALAALKPLETAAAWNVDELLLKKALTTALDTWKPEDWQQVKAIGVEFEKKTGPLQGRRKSVDATSKQLDEAWKVAKVQLPADEVIAAFAELDTFQMLSKAGDLEGAQPLGEDLLKRLGERTKALGVAKSAWEGKSAEVAKVIEGVETLQKMTKPAVGQGGKTVETPVLPGPMLMRATAILGLVKVASAKGGSPPNYDLLLANLTKAQLDLGNLEKESASFLSFRPSCENADEAMKPKFVDLRKLVDEVVKGLTPLMPEEKPENTAGVRGFLGEISAIESQWNGRVSQATDVNSLQQKDTESRVTELAERLRAAADPTALAGVAAGAADQKARQEFAAQLAKLRETIAKLRATGPGAAVAFAGEAAAAEKKAETDLPGAVAEVKGIQSSVDKAIRSAEADGAAMKDVFKNLLAMFNGMLDRLGSLDGKEYRDAGKALAAERDKLEKSTNTQNLEAARFVKAELEELIHRADHLLDEAINAKKGGGAGRKTLAEVLQKQADVKEKWEAGRKHLQNFSPTLEKQLKKRWDELLKAVPTISANEGDARLTEFSRDLDTAHVGANNVEELQTEVKGRLAAVTSELEALKKREGKTLYMEELAKRLETAKKMSGELDKLLGAQSRLQELQEEIVDARGSVAVAVQKEVELKSKAEEKEKAEAAWTPAESQMEAQLDEVKKLIESQHGDMAQHEELVKLFELAQETKKKGDPATAMRQLAAMGAQVRQVIQDPSGPNLGSRNQLPQDMAKYKESLQQFIAVLNGLPASIRSAVPTLRADVEKKMIALLDGAISLLPVHAFDAVIGKMTTPGLTVPQLRALREIALGKVHEIMATLAEHPQLKALTDFPVDPGAVASAFQRLRNALTRMEGNLRRACR